MDSLANTKPGNLSRRDQLAAEVRMLRLTINVSMFQMAAKFIEAKELVPHGEWGRWLEENADVSERTARDMMAAYRRFGENPKFAEIDSSKLFKLLPLPESREEDFLQEHDVSEMSAREIQEEVRKVREEMAEEKQKALNDLREQMRNEQACAAERERARAEEEISAIRDKMGREFQIETERIEAEARITVEEARKAAEERVSGLQQAMAAKEAAIEQMKATAQAALEGTENWRGERAEMENKLARLRKELAESEEVIREQQNDLNQAQEELLNMKSQQARGEERSFGDELTPETMTQAAREFIGICARGPHMHRAFSTMAYEEKQKYLEVVAMMRAWVEGMEEALDTVAGEAARYAEGGVVIE